MKIMRLLKVAAPAALALLVAGCITDPYRYGGGYGGDYYYGSPSVEYRHHGYYGPYGAPYHGGWRFGMRYGYPYRGYGYGYGGGWPGHYYGWGGWPGYPPIVVRPRPDHEPDPGNDPDPGHDPGGDGQGPPPWRDLDRMRDGGVNPPIQVEPRLPRVHRPSQPPRVMQPRVERPQVERPQVERPRAERPAVSRPPTPSRPPRATSGGGSRLERVQRMHQARDER